METKMFANAKKVAVLPVAVKGKAPPKSTTTIEGLAEVAALDACMKAIKGLLDLKKEALKSSAIEQLIETGIERHSKPDHLSLVEGEATGRVAITKRSTASPLSTDEVELLAEMVGDVVHDTDGNITAVPGFAEILESIPASLQINPIYASNEDLLKKIDKALSGVKGIPEDFVISVPASSKMVVSDSATDAVFRLPVEQVETVFGLIARVSLTPAFKDIGKAWEIVKPLLTPGDAKAQVKKMLTGSLKAI
jgi:hypothetical protein